MKTFTTTSKIVWPARLFDTNRARLLREQLARAAGGYTTVDGIGAWVHDGGKYEEEDITVVSVHYSVEPGFDAVPTVLDRIALYLLQQGETAVLVTDDGVPRLLYQSDKDTLG